MAPGTALYCVVLLDAGSSDRSVHTRLLNATSTIGATCTAYYLCLFSGASAGMGEEGSICSAE